MICPDKSGNNLQYSLFRTLFRRSSVYLIMLTCICTSIQCGSIKLFITQNDWTYVDHLLWKSSFSSINFKLKHFSLSRRWLQPIQIVIGKGFDMKDHFYGSRGGQNWMKILTKHRGKHSSKYDFLYKCKIEKKENAYIIKNYLCNLSLSLYITMS